MRHKLRTHILLAVFSSLAASLPSHSAAPNEQCLKTLFPPWHASVFSASFGKLDPNSESVQALAVELLRKNWFIVENGRSLPLGNIETMKIFVLSALANAPVGTKIFDGLSQK